MAEYIPEEYLKPGHHFDASNVRLDLYRLLALVLADQAVSKLATQSNIFSDLQGEYLEYEVTRILLSSAIALRVEFDRHPKDVWKDWKTECGTLFEPYRVTGSKFKGKPLELRVACNKVIHASKIHWDVVGKYPGLTYVRPYIYLYGKDRKVDWRAKLSVVLFVRRAVAVLNGFGYQSA